MKKPFFAILFVLLVINFSYKGFLYFSYEKAEGQVIGFYDFTTKQVRTGKYDGQQHTSFEKVASPLIIYKLDELECQIALPKWGYINFLETGDPITVMVNEKRDKVEINSFFQFWVTFYDLIIAFAICFVGSIVLGIVLPERKPTVWK